MALRNYNQKRKFDKTPEPKGTLHKKGKKLRFVVQKHDATRLHYDFRLEMQGVLKSWAVPKGPSLNPDDKRLAVQVEDHPYDYRNFEGVIPEGNYGAGTVIVWDEGTYEAYEEGDEDEKLLVAGLKKGDLKFVLHGKKLQGAYALVQIKKDPKNWLLIKKKDEYATEKDVTIQDESVKTGVTVDDAGTDPVKDMKKSNKITKQEMPHKVKPMLATLAEQPFNNENYLYEIKWDGYRAIAEIEKRDVRLYSRNNQDFSEKYSLITEELADIEHDCVLDGEIVALDSQGNAKFQLLQDYGMHRKAQLMYYVFDILYLDGYDLRNVPLLERKKLLKEILNETSHIKYSDHIDTQGIELFKAAKAKNLEGIIAKRKNSTYTSSRSDDWQKIKNIQMQEAVICGYTEPKGSRKEFGALILGIYENKEWRYVGHTGGGFDEKKLVSIKQILKPLIRKKSPFTIEPATNAPATWLQPKIVCQVKFSEWTNEGIMRQPVFLGIRDDKKAEEVMQETTGHIHSAKKSTVQNNNGKLKLTNLDKVYFPEEGYTKGDLIAYYESIAEYILPYLKDRPQSLNRFPNGIHGESFFQKDIDKAPKWIKTVPIYSESNKKNIDWLICNNKDTLLYMANLGCIEINPWNARYQKKDYPDYLIIDLDPHGIEFKETIRTAHCVKEIMDSAHIDSFIKTSGKKGLHILVPLKAKYTHDQTKQFAEILANVVFQELPDITSVVRNPKKREHKIYIDFLQNREGQTIAAPYCVRPTVTASVSTPLDWKEIDESMHPTDFTIKNTLKRLQKNGDVWKNFKKHKGINMLKSLDVLFKLKKQDK